VASNLRTSVLLVVVGILIGAGAAFFVSQRLNSRALDDISSKLDASQTTIAIVRERLGSVERTGAESIVIANRLRIALDTELERRKYAERQLSQVSERLGSVAERLGEGASDIDGVIVGLEEVKDLIRHLP
jgi:hypothetical protein